jgi:hypothetical protein
MFMVVLSVSVRFAAVKHHGSEFHLPYNLTLQNLSASIIFFTLFPGRGNAVTAFTDEFC